MERDSMRRSPLDFLISKGPPVQSVRDEEKKKKKDDGGRKQEDYIDGLARAVSLWLICRF
jgi:hypothetical protein